MGSMKKGRKMSSSSREGREEVPLFCEPMAVLWGNVLLTQGSPDQAEGQREADEGPVPLVVLPHGGHAHEDEDQGLADTAQHLHEVLDGRVGFLRYIFFHILVHSHCTSGDSARTDTAAISDPNQNMSWHLRAQHAHPSAHDHNIIN